MACTSHKVYFFKNDGLLCSELNYYIKTKDKLEVYIPDRPNTIYAVNLMAGFIESEIKEFGVKEITEGYSDIYTISVIDSVFVFEKKLNKNETEVNILPVLKTQDTNFLVTSLFELKNFDGWGISNNVRQPWMKYHGVAKRDTLYSFDHQKPVEAIYLELVPNRSEKPSTYVDPIKVFIEKETGIPLYYEYYWFDNMLNTTQTTRVYCMDYKVMKMSKRRIKKVLW